jgi:hypothetical protein
MASFNGLKKIAATDIQNSGRFYLGNQVDPGTAGQVIVSAGPNNPVEWGTNSAVLPNALSAGSHITFSSGNPSFDGSIADTINATPGGGLISGNGIDIAGATISTDNDGVTINNTGGTGTQNQVLKVPNDLTISQNGTIIDTFNGSTAKTIDLEGKYIAGDGIDISGHPVPHIEADTDEVTISHNVGGAEQLQVLKVPNTLTITDSAGTSVVYDGSSTQSITINDNDTNYSAGNGMSLSGTTFSTDNDGFTIRNTGGQNEVLRVPNALIKGTNINFSSGTTYDGSSAITISSTDTNTQLALVEDPGIVITSTGGLNRTIGARTDGTTIGFSGNDLTTIKVPNALTAGTNISFSSGTTYDGSAAITINASDTDTTYQGGTGISIDTATNPDTINCSNIPNSALANSTISGISLGSNLANLTFYQADGTFITSYNGANPPTSITLDGDTTYQGGKNITIDTTTNPDTIDLDDDLTGIDSISFTNSSGTTLTGSNASGTPTIATYLDLRSTTNLIPGAVLATKIQRTSSIRSFTNVYSEYSSNFRTSFTAQSANVMVEFRALVRADNRVFYGGLYNYNAGSYNTDTRNRFNYNDETDQDHTVLTWWMRNLTPGSTYYVSPYFRGSSSTVYIYAGHSGNVNGFAPGIMRIIDGGNNVNIY